jgi:hypothetical protein
VTRLPGHEVEEGVGGAEALKRHAMGRITDRSDGRGQRCHLRFILIVLRTLDWNSRALAEIYLRLEIPIRILMMRSRYVRSEVQEWAWRLLTILGEADEYTTAKLPTWEPAPMADDDYDAALDVDTNMMRLSKPNPLGGLRLGTPMTVRQVRERKTDVCYHCKQAGHWKINCPLLQQERLAADAGLGGTSPRAGSASRPRSAARSA